MSKEIVRFSEKGRDMSRSTMEAEALNADWEVETRWVEKSGDRVLIRYKDRTLETKSEYVVPKTIK